MFIFQHFGNTKSFLWLKPLRAYVVIIALFTTVSEVYSQNSDLLFRHLSTDNGLSHKNIHALLQDSHDFIWIGTKNGLNIYNGYTVQTLVNDPKNAESLPSNDVRALAEDQEGYIWVGTYDNGLIRLNPRTKKGKVYTTSNTKALTTNTISTIYCDKKGNIWIATFGGGLLMFNPKTQQFTAYQHNASQKNGLTSNNIITLHADSQENLWLGTFGGGLCKFNPQKKIFTTYLDGDKTDIYAIEEDKYGYLWLGTYGKGLIRLDKHTGKAESFSTQATKGLGSDYIRAIKEDAVGILWIGTEKNGGLTCYDPVRKQFSTHKKDPVKSTSLIHNNINTLMLDKLGILWVGTEGAGVDQFNTQNRTFKAYLSGVGATPTFTDGAITALYEDRAQVLWIGGTFTEGLSLYAYDRITGKYTSYKLPLQKDLLVFNYTITAISEDDLGNIWVGTAENGLFRYDKQNKSFRLITHTNSELSSNGIETIYKDRKGIMWIGTYEGGLCRLDPYRENIKTYVHDPANPKSLIDNTIKIIFEDSKGNLWLGTKQHGLSVLNPESGIFINYQTSKDSDKSLPGNSIRAITESNNRIWIGTDGGICRFEADSKTFAHVNIQNGLPENDVCGMLADKNGNLWISTFSKGLARFNPETYKFRYFTTGEGLFSNEFQQWSAHKNYNGELFFGGSRHFIGFQPEQIIENTYIAPVYITSFSLFDKKKEFGKPLYELSTIELNYNDNFFEFEFTFLNYLDTDNNIYAYMMENVDNNWKQIGDRRLASYTNLDPGDYIFRVKAADKYNQWNETGASIRIVIHPAWYQTWWARISAAVIILGSIFLYYRSRIRFFQKQKQILEGLVVQRTAELVQKNAEIEAQKNSIEDKNIRLINANELIEQINEELRTINNDLEYRVEQRTYQLKVANENLIKSNQELDMFIYRASHDIKGPLASLSGLCKVAHMDVHDAKAQEYFLLLDKTCDKANHTLVRILKMYDIRNAEIHYEALNIITMIEEYASELNKLPAYTDVDFKITTTSSGELMSDKSLLYIILTNLIENAFRYRRDRGNSYVKVQIEEIDQHIHIRVYDNGIGIPQNLWVKLFTMFFRGTVNASGTGLGLYIAKLAIERLGGKITYRTDFTQETVFEVVVPRLPESSVDLPLSLPSKAEPHLLGG